MSMYFYKSMFRYYFRYIDNKNQKQLNNFWIVDSGIVYNKLVDMIHDLVKFVSYSEDVVIVDFNNCGI